jgi:putative PIN family toxin of toxin-antitoxin system
MQSPLLRLVLDTNVWLDWLVFDEATLAPLKAAVAERRAEIYIDAACEAELERVLAYDLGRHSIDAAARAGCLAECRRIARPMPEGKPADWASLPRCADPGDQMFLEAALAARADCLVTKDRALLELGRGRRSIPFRIVTPDAWGRGWNSVCTSVQTNSGPDPEFR